MENIVDKKNHWMASHITEAQFPTPLSQTGLSIYLSKPRECVTLDTSKAHPSQSESAITIYPVDCHPLTIRYSIVLASQWQDETEKEAMIEYLTQIMFEPESPAELYVGFYHGKPAACGMIFHDEQHGDLIADVYALPIAQQAQLIEDMHQALISRCHHSNVYIETNAA